MASNRRKSAAIALAVIGVAGLSLASAAQLTVNSSTLQAGSDLVTTCDDSGVDVSYGFIYDGTAYVANSVTVANIDAACIGGQIGVTLEGTSGTEVTLASAAIGSATFTSAITPISAADLASVAVVISR